MRLWVYVVRRVALLLPLLLILLTVLFVLVSSLPTTARVCAYGAFGRNSPCTSTVPCPSDPAQTCSNPTYGAAVSALGLKQPVIVQWAIFVYHSFTFNWGYVSQGSALGTGAQGFGLPALGGTPVSHLIAEFLPYSLELLGLTFLITLAVVLPLRRRALDRPGGISDRVSRGIFLTGYGIPLFMVAFAALWGAAAAAGGAAAPSAICGGASTVFQDFYGSWPQPPCVPLYTTSNLSPIGYPNWLRYGVFSTPTGFPTLDAALHGLYWLSLDTVLRMLLPALVLALVASATVFRFLRFPMRGPEEVERISRAPPPGRDRGRILASTLPAFAPALVVVLGFLPVVEIIFNLWGVGTLFVDAMAGPARNWDLATAYGILFTLVALTLIVRVLLDSLHAYLDPRRRVWGRVPTGLEVPGRVPPTPGVPEPVPGDRATRRAEA